MTGVLAARKQGLPPRADRTRLSPARAPDRGVRLGRGVLRPHGAREEVMTLVGPWWGLGPGLDTPTGPARPAWTRELWGETGRAEPGEGGAAAWPGCGPVLGSVLAAPSHSGNLGAREEPPRFRAHPRRTDRRLPKVRASRSSVRNSQLRGPRTERGEAPQAGGGGGGAPLVGPPSALLPPPSSRSRSEGHREPRSAPLRA